VRPCAISETWKEPGLRNRISHLPRFDYFWVPVLARRGFLSEWVLNTPLSPREGCVLVGRSGSAKSGGPAGTAEN
jgi:hypothetical protein